VVIKMLKQLRIQNFKGWQDTGDIRLAPISLFFGANSSGKSSIGQFLMMLKQTVESPDRKAVFYPGGRSSAVQLGSYQEMVFNRDIKKKISFKYQWSFSNALRLKDPVHSKSVAGD
jgi:AAA15 family ATPase/GTPase